MRKVQLLKIQFGLAQALAYFQNLKNKVLNGLYFTLAYLDDVIIFSESAEQHLKHIQIVLTRLKQAKLRLKKSKCLFFKQELHYLGHLQNDQWNQTAVREDKGYIRDEGT